MDEQEHDDWITIAKAAKMVHLIPQSIYAAIRKGRLQSQEIPNKKPLGVGIRQVVLHVSRAEVNQAVIDGRLRPRFNQPSLQIEPYGEAGWQAELKDKTGTAAERTAHVVRTDEHGRCLYRQTPDGWQHIADATEFDLSNTAQDRPFIHKKFRAMLERLTRQGRI